MSASLVPPGVYVAGEASVASGAGLLEDAQGGLFALSLPGLQSVHVADHLPRQASVVFAPSGRNAVVYASGGGTIWLVSGLPATPQVEKIDLPPGHVASAATVSDRGTLVIAEGSGPAAVETLSANGTISLLTHIGAPGGMSFVALADSLLLADQAAGSAFLIEHVNSGPAIHPLNAAGLSRPVAIAGTHDGHWAVAADSADAGVVRMDLTGGTAAIKVLCACQPGRVLPLQGGGSFRINELYDGPAWTVDVTASEPHLVFVPAIAAGTP